MRLVSLDCETHLIQPGLLAPPLVCVQWYDGTERQVLNRDPGLAWFRAAIQDQSIVWIGHNIAFDFGVLCAADPSVVPFVFQAYDQGRVYCTKLRQQLLDIATGCFRLPRSDGTQGYGLADCELHYFKRDRSSEKNDPGAWRLRYRELEHLHVDLWPRPAVDYALADVDGAWDVFHAQPRDIGSEHDQAYADLALHLISVHGITVDLDAVARLKDELMVQQQRNQQRLILAGLYKPGGTSKRVASWTWSKDMAKIKAAVERFYKRRGQATPQTDSGKIATDKDALNQSGSRVLALLADGGGVDKLLTTYIPAMEQGAKGPINVKFNTLVRTGRTSSYGSESDDGTIIGFNIQNLPTGRRVGGIRECIVPRPGYLLTRSDYSTLELRTLAQVCLEWFGQSDMATALRADRDLHVDLACEMLGLPYEQGAALHEIEDEAFENQRDAAKPGNFGFPGGLGPRGMQVYARTIYKVTLSLKQCQELKNSWLRKWREMGPYLARIGRQFPDYGSKATVRDEVTGFVRGDCIYTAACNFYFQGRAGAGMKRALVKAQREAYVDRSSPFFGSRLLATVHDEFIAEVPISVAHEASHRMAEIMVEGMTELVPDVPIKTSKPVLMERWYKKAQPVFVGGRLVPWDPILHAR